MCVFQPAVTGDLCAPGRGAALRADTKPLRKVVSVCKNPVKRSTPKTVADYPETNCQSYTLTFISWLISLLTGCAGFLLRLFSGGLPFSISGIVLARSVSLFGGRKVRSESLDG